MSVVRKISDMIEGIEIVSENAIKKYGKSSRSRVRIFDMAKTLRQTWTQYQAIDNIDGDITENVAVTGTVDSSTPGVYNITYSVSDKSNNSAISKKRTVTVVADKVPPVLKINGQN